MKKEIIGLLTGLITLLFLLFGLFFLAITIAGGHKYSGLFGHSDSFKLYMAVLLCLAIISSVNTYSFLKYYNKSKIYKFLVWIFSSTLLIFGSVTLIQCVIVDISFKAEVDFMDYVLNFLVLAILSISILKLKKHF